MCDGRKLSLSKRLGSLSNVFVPGEIQGGRKLWYNNELHPSIGRRVANARCYLHPSTAHYAGIRYVDTKRREKKASSYEVAWHRAVMKGPRPDLGKRRRSEPVLYYWIRRRNDVHERIGDKSQFVHRNQLTIRPSRITFKKKKKKKSSTMPYLTHPGTHHLIHKKKLWTPKVEVCTKTESNQLNSPDSPHNTT